MSKAAKKRAKMPLCFRELDKRSGLERGCVIGFDFSLTSTGFCVLDIEGNVKEIGTSKTGPKDGSVRNRLDLHCEVFKRLIKKYDPIVVAYEMVVVARHLDSFKKLILTQAQLYRAVSDSNLDDPFIIPVGIPTIKRIITGDHRADKKIIIKETYKKWSVDTDSDDAADAHGAARVGLECLKLCPAFMKALKSCSDEDRLVMDWIKGKIVKVDDQDLYDAVCSVMQSNMTTGDNDL